jgi:hypothetical protein
VAQATSRGLTPVARSRVRVSARAKRALGDKACLMMRSSSSRAWTRRAPAKGVRHPAGAWRGYVKARGQYSVAIRR